jgi:hypothetical protein
MSEASNVHFLNETCKSIERGGQALDGMARHLMIEAGAIASLCAGDTGMAGYFLVALQTDGSYRFAYRSPEGETLVSPTMFAAFVKEVATREIITEVVVKNQINRL